MRIFSILLLFLFVLISCKREKSYPKFIENTLTLRDEALKPFYHGVASGDPLHDGIILWTRVTPKFIDKEIFHQLRL